MSQRRRIQTDVPETEDPDGSLRDGRPGGDWYRRMSLRGRVKMGGLAVLAFPLRDIHMYHLPWFYVSETDVTDGCP